jgi:hypothetical protein
MAVQLRGVLYTLCAFIVFCLALAADTVNVGSITIGGGETWFTLWTTPGSDPSATTYGDFNNQIRTARAFVILTILCIFPCILIGLVDMFSRRTTFHENVHKNYRMIMMGTAFLNFVWCTIAWPILFALPPTLKADVSNAAIQASYTIGPAPIVMVIAWAFIVVMILAALFLPEPLEVPVEGQKQQPPAPQPQPQPAVRPYNAHAPLA